MMRQYDFALKLHSRDTAKLSYQTQLEAIQRFSIDADVSFDRALNMPYWLLDDFYKKADVEVKVLLLGSYFTEKLIFEKNKFRTLPFNEVISLLCRYNRDFQRLKKETGVDLKTNPRYVPQTVVTK